MKINTFRSICLASACTAGLGFATQAAASDPVTVSGASPFAACSVAQPGTNYFNAEVEPWVDANPSNPDNLIAGWQQDRWSNGGARSLMSGYTLDGGQNWTQVVVPGINKCSGGTGNFAFDRSSDPWVTISPDGTAYFMSLSFNNDEPSGAGGDNAMLVSRSTDGGASWSAPQALILDTDGQIFNDKNAVTADPSDSNFVYASWDRLVDFTLPSAGNRARGGDGAANARARYRKIHNLGGMAINPVTFLGPAYFTRTINGGTSWEPARLIHDPGPNAQTINNLIAVLHNGDVMNFFTEILHNGKTRIGYVRSTDQGFSFDRMKVAVDMNVTLFGTTTPDARAPVRDANILFDVAVDRHHDHHAEHHNNIYLVWQDGRFQNLDRVFFSMSTNDGASWSPPVMIAKTPYSTNKLRRQSFIPSVEVGADHKVVVTYYDFRNDTDSKTEELSDLWAISCDIAIGADCRTAGGWGSEARLTPASFNMLDAPVARGHFLGDYQGLVNAGGNVIAVFGKAVSDNQNDIFSTKVP